MKPLGTTRCVQTFWGGSATACKGAVAWESTSWQSTAAKVDWHANSAKNALVMKQHLFRNFYRCPCSEEWEEPAAIFR
jgi:hypothetical protein